MNGVDKGEGGSTNVAHLIVPGAMWDGISARGGSVEALRHRWEATEQHLLPLFLGGWVDTTRAHYHAEFRGDKKMHG